MRSIQKYIRIDRSHIAYCKFIIEAYEGIGVLSTYDAAEGIVVIAVAPGCETIVAEIIKEFQREMLVEELLGEDMPDTLPWESRT